MFHDSIPQHLSFDEAQSYCRAAGAELATTAQLYFAWSEGLDRCSPGWLSDGSVRYPIITPRDRCGGPQAGVKTLYRFSNQTGFPEPSSLHDVYCFKGVCFISQNILDIIFVMHSNWYLLMLLKYLFKISTKIMIWMNSYNNQLSSWQKNIFSTFVRYLFTVCMHVI